MPTQAPRPGAYQRVMHGCGLAAALSLAIVMLLICCDVVLRNLGLASMPWVVEVTEYALYFCTFLAAPWLLHRNEHVRLDLLAAKLSRRQARDLERLIAVLCLCVSLALTWYSLAVIADARAAGTVVIKTLRFPEWWLFIPLPLCFGLLALESLRRLLRADVSAATPVAGTTTENI